MDTVRAVAGGAGMVVIGNGLDVSMHSMVAAAEIAEVTDLKDKRVIVGGVNDITNIWWRAMAEDHGLDPDADVETLFAGSTSNRFAALVAGGVEAAVLAPPTSFRAEEEGYTDLGAVAAYLTGVPYLVFHVDRAWATDNPESVVAFVRAHNRAIDFLTDPANREEVASILVEAANVEEAIALQNLDLVLEIGAFAEQSRVNPEGVAKAIDILVNDGDISGDALDVADVYDAGFVDQAAVD
jgi:NitT/TauT family transport system substrate-binding protein